MNKLVDDVVKTNTPNGIIHTGIFDKRDTYKNELLRYKVSWLKVDQNNYRSVSSKTINVSQNMTNGTFLSNVAVIHPLHINEILKIQKSNRCGLKMVNKRHLFLNNTRNVLEPQDVKFLSKLPRNLLIYNHDYIYTYTEICVIKQKNIYLILIKLI